LPHRPLKKWPLWTEHILTGTQNWAHFRWLWRPWDRIPLIKNFIETGLTIALEWRRGLHTVVSHPLGSIWVVRSNPARVWSDS
jgi:hypothetical protein